MQTEKYKNHVMGNLELNNKVLAYRFDERVKPILMLFKV